MSIRLHYNEIKTYAKPHLNRECLVWAVKMEYPLLAVWSPKTETGLEEGIWVRSYGPNIPVCVGDLWVYLEDIKP